MVSPVLARRICSTRRPAACAADLREIRRHRPLPPSARRWAEPGRLCGAIGTPNDDAAGLDAGAVYVLDPEHRQDRSDFIESQRWLLEAVASAIRSRPRVCWRRLAPLDSSGGTNAGGVYLFNLDPAASGFGTLVQTFRSPSVAPSFGPNSAAQSLSFWQPASRWCPDGRKCEHDLYGCGLRVPLRRRSGQRNLRQHLEDVGQNHATRVGACFPAPRRRLRRRRHLSWRPAGQFGGRNRSLRGDVLHGADRCHQ